MRPTNRVVEQVHYLLPDNTRPLFIKTKNAPTIGVIIPAPAKKIMIIIIYRRLLMRLLQIMMLKDRNAWEYKQ
jgi:hypothetical protein